MFSCQVSFWNTQCKGSNACKVGTVLCAGFYCKLHTHSLLARQSCLLISRSAALFAKVRLRFYFSGPPTSVSSFLLLAAIASIFDKLSNRARSSLRKDNTQLKTSQQHPAPVWMLSSLSVARAQSWSSVEWTQMGCQNETRQIYCCSLVIQKSSVRLPL